MDFLQKILSRFNFREGRECKRQIVPFMDMVRQPANDVRQGYYYTQKERIISVIRAAKEERQRLFRDYENLSHEQKADVWRVAGDIKQECILEVEKMSSCPATMYLILRDLESKELRDVSRFVFEVLFGRPDEAFFTMIKESREEVYTLAEDINGDIEFYGFKFKKIPLQEAKIT